MSSSLQVGVATRLTGSTAETTLFAKPAVLLGVVVNNTMAGTLTIRDGVAGTVMAILPIGTVVQDIEFGPFGVGTTTGLTAQLSNAADAVTMVWMPE